MSRRSLAGRAYGSGPMRLIVARCEVRYSGRLDAVMAALETEDAGTVMEQDGVVAESLVILVEQ